MKTFAMSSLM